jgi:ABC-type multidrug transport system fused ATPase/permease subunit
VAEDVPNPNGSGRHSQPAAKPRLLATSREDWALVWHQVRGQRRLIIAVAGLSVLGSLAEVTSLVVLGVLATKFISSGATKSSSRLSSLLELTTAQLIFLTLGTVVLAAVIDVLVGVLSARCVSLYELNIRERLPRAFADARWDVQEQQQPAEVQEIVVTGLSDARSGYRTMLSLLGTAVSLVLMGVSTIAIGGWYVIPIGILIVALSMAVRPASLATRRVAKQTQRMAIAYSLTFEEMVSLSMEVRLRRASAAMLARLVRRARSLERVRRRMYVLMNVTPIVYEAAGTIVILGTAGLLIQLDLIGPAALAPLALLSIRLVQYARSLQGSNQMIRASIPAFELIQERIDMYEASPEPERPEHAEGIGRIEFDTVSFRYPGASKDALHDVSFVIEANDTIGVIGPSGGGKSTMLQLLCALREPTSGEVRIDGVDLREVSLDSYYRSLGFAAQDARLFKGTVLENVLFFDAELTDADAKDACARSQLVNDVHGLVDGFETVVGPGTRGLSGGQRQRMGVARALVVQPQLLVLDEPTSALDVHTEQALTETLAELRGSVTLVIVAHRLSTLRLCDKVLIVNDGRIAAFGEREELERDNEYYSQALALARIV